MILATNVMPWSLKGKNCHPTNLTKTIDDNVYVMIVGMNGSKMSPKFVKVEWNL